MENNPTIELLIAARRWRTLWSELATMEASQSDEMGFSDSEIEPIRELLKEAEAKLQFAVDKFGEIPTKEHLAILNGTYGK